MIDDCPATAAALVDVDKVDELVDLNNSFFQMDGKLVGERDLCIDFIDEKALDELMLLMADDIDFIDREYNETRAASQDVLKSTQQQIRIFQ